MIGRAHTLEEAEAFRAGGCPFCRGREFREGGDRRPVPALGPNGGPQAVGTTWECLTCGAIVAVGAAFGQFWPHLLEIVREPLRSNAANLAEGGHKPASDLLRHGDGAGPIPDRLAPRPWRRSGSPRNEPENGQADRPYGDSARNTESAPAATCSHRWYSRESKA